MIHDAGDDASPDLEETAAWQRQVLALEARGRVTRTFRRLDPDRQRAVVDAVIDEIAEHGPAAVQVKRIAERAGVSVGSLYQYFPRREGMLDAAVEMTTGFLTASLDSYAPFMAELPLREGLRCYLSEGIEWSASYTSWLGLFARAAYSGTPGYADTLVRPVAGALQRMLRALLTGARDRGDLRPDLDLETAVRLVHTLTIAVGDAELMPHLNDYYLLLDADHPPERIREATVELIVRAIGRQP
ncbi:MAG: TetR/AcrR family transcriptional regulator [Actinomycetales bacterium]|nr:TetR/AcrR family transcriptional regulator [Actinomycetales bacterium]